MASTYTDNNGIELIGDGEQAGNWGSTTNTNLEIIDRIVNGVGSVSLSGQGATFDLATSDGDKTSNGMLKVITFTSADQACTITITPNNAQKLYFVYNNAGHALTFKQGSSGSTVAIPNGNAKVIFADGGGASAGAVKDFTGLLDVDLKKLSISGTEVTSTAAELNLLDGSAAGTIANSKGVIYGSSGEVNATTLQIGGTSITATAAELNYVDGVTSAIQTQIDNIVTVPAGVVAPYAGTSAPSGYLLCYGQAVSRTTYSDLFSAIGTTYGTGDGSSTFNLPDLRGRAIAGQDDMGGSSANRLTGQTGGVNGDTLGGTGGGETHTLTTAQLASHTHSVSSVTVYGWYGGGGGDGSFSGSGLRYQTTSNNGNQVNVQGTTGATASGGSGTHTASIANAGSGSAHNNVQPTIILNYIIKT